MHDYIYDLSIQHIKKNQKKFIIKHYNTSICILKFSYRMHPKLWWCNLGGTKCKFYSERRWANRNYYLLNLFVF